MAHNASAIVELEPKGLRRFGISTGAIVAVLFGLLLPWIFDRSYPRWPWIVFVTLSLWALVAPSSLRLVYRLWMRIGLLLGRITTPIVLGIVFYLIVVPFGVVKRVFGRDSMARVFDGQISTYRVKSERTGRQNLERPY